MVSLWNALPQNIKLSQSLAHFKNLMRKRLLMDSYVNLFSTEYFKCYSSFTSIRFQFLSEF